MGQCLSSSKVIPVSPPPPNVLLQLHTELREYGHIFPEQFTGSYYIFTKKDLIRIYEQDAIIKTLLTQVGLEYGEKEEAQYGEQFARKKGGAAEKLQRGFQSGRLRFTQSTKDIFLDQPREGGSAFF